MRIPAFLVALYALSPAAWAGSDWIGAEGRLAFGVTDRVAGADLFIAGDADLRLNFGRFGVELGVYGRADALDTPHETYGVVTLDIGAEGRLSAGVPRAAYDGFAVSGFELHFPALAVDRAALTRSEATWGAMFGGYLPLGVAFENRAGGLRYALSVHHADAAGRSIGSVGVGWDAGDWRVEGAVELAEGGSTDVSGKLAVSGTSGAWSGGLAFYAPALAADTVEGHLSYAFSDRLSATGLIAAPVSGGSATAGASVRYEAGEHVGLSLGVVSEAGADAAYSAFVDFRF